VYLPYRRVALGYRLAMTILIAIGIARLSGLFGDGPQVVQLLFFTTQSNILCLVWAVLLVLRTVRDLRADGPRGWSSPSPRFGAAVMMAITVTMLIYLVVLVPQTFTQGSGYTPFTVTDNLVHIITPCLTIGDWLLFVPKGRLRWYDPPLWVLIPYAYAVFAFTWHGFGGDFGPGQAYPYPFLDVDRLGVGGVAAWLIGLTVVLMAVGYLYVMIDRLLGRVSFPRPHEHASV